MIGIGFDIHRLVKGRCLLLGGVKVRHPKGLLGHSDGDVLLHAICDAILGAAGAGDIGDHFPDTDPRFKNADSRLFVREVKKLVEHKGYRVKHLDTIIFAEAPKLNRIKDDIRSRVAVLLKLSVKQVNIKAKTFEGLGIIGKKQAIAVLALASLSRAKK